jgi:hypothetical protein
MMRSWRGNAERVRHGDNVPRNLDIGARGGWIAERVIVQNVTISAILLLLPRLRALAGEGLAAAIGR